MTKKQARIKDIAFKAGVSTGTVDRVIHKRGEVSKATREKILEIIDELEYQPNLLASSLASRKKNRFAVLIPEGDQQNPYWNAPITGVIKAAKELEPYGIQSQILTFSSGNTKDFRKKAQIILDDPPQAVLLAPIFYEESQRFLKQAELIQLPIAFIDSHMSYPYTVQAIGQNACQSGQVAGRLMSLGQPKNPVFLLFNIIGEKDQLHHFSERVKGFISYFEQRSYEAVITSKDIEGDDKQITEGLRYFKNRQLDGIFVSGSKVYQVARALESQKMAGIRLIGYDLVKENLQYLERETIDVLLSQKPEEQGYIGIQVLYASLIQNQKLAERLYTPIDIITRENINEYLNCP